MKKMRLAPIIMGVKNKMNQGKLEKKKVNNYKVLICRQ